MKNDSLLEFNILEEGQLLEYLYNNVKNKSKNNIKSLLNRKNVLVNDKPITQFDYKLIKGDIVTIMLKQILDKKYHRLLDILYEDDEIIVINKPYGLLSISTEKEKENTAYKLVMEYLKHKNPGNKVFVVHRLDKDTSGILMFAKNEDIKHLLQDNWNSIVKVRGYVAVVEGNVEKDEDKIVSYLKESKTQEVYSSRDDDGKIAITSYKKIDHNKYFSLLDIKIETGRRNQIRVHMRDIKHPVLGDKKYDSTKNILHRLCLHSYILELVHPITNKIMHFETPIPNEFKSIFKK